MRNTTKLYALLDDCEQLRDVLVRTGLQPGEEINTTLGNVFPREDKSLDFSQASIDHENSSSTKVSIPERVVVEELEVPDRDLLGAIFERKPLSFEIHIHVEPKRVVVSQKTVRPSLSTSSQESNGRRGKERCHRTNHGRIFA